MKKKLTKGNIDTIRRAYQDGSTLEILARRYKRSISTIWNIVENKNPYFSKGYEKERVEKTTLTSFIANILNIDLDNPSSSYDFIQDTSQKVLGKHIPRTSLRESIYRELSKSNSNKKTKGKK